MIRHNLRAYGYLITIINVLLFIIILQCHSISNEIDFYLVVKSLFETVSVFIFIAIGFTMWGWKWKYFYPWLVPFPNLSGKWTGSIKSNWEAGGTDIPIEVTISQNFFGVQVKLSSGESISQSVTSNFDIDRDRGIERFFYSYFNTPNVEVRDRSELHFGTTVLNFTGRDVTEMNGHYWTDRLSRGDISLQRIKEVK